MDIHGFFINSGNRRLKKKIASALGMAALSFALIGISEVVSVKDTSAASLGNEKGLAGFSLTLDRYYDSITVEEAVEKNQLLADSFNSIRVVSSNQTDTSQTVAAASVNVDIEDDNVESDHVSVKDLLSNINYGRLGIAKVDNYLNIRKRPGEDGKIIGKLPKNAGCHIYKIKDGWAKIISNGVSGWVCADYLITDEEAEEYALSVATKVATVNTGSLRARFLPSVDSKVYALIAIEEDLTVVKENLSREYVDKIIDKYYTGEDAFLIEDVDIEEMYKDLDNWICVKLNGEKIFISKDFITISYQLKKAVEIDEDEYSSDSGISSVRSQMVNFAMQYLGCPYVWGGTSLGGGADCSGFVMRVYENYGYYLPRTSYNQASYCNSISYSEAQPGDLFFYGNGYSVSHVAMYIGNGQIIHAMDENHGICISSAYYMSPMKIGRIIYD